jgi:hypothetical protein
MRRTPAVTVSGRKPETVTAQRPRHLVELLVIIPAPACGMMKVERKVEWKWLLSEVSSTLGSIVF